MLRVNNLVGFSKRPLINVALAARGSTASGSTEVAGYAPSSAINGLRHTNNAWGSDGGYSSDVGLPQTLTVDFNTTRIIRGVDVFFLADAVNYNTDPTLADTFTLYGEVDFAVDYWDGAAWQNLATVAGNNKVWRRWVFAPVSASKIRVTSTVGTDPNMQVIEIEAWGN